MNLKLILNEKKFFLDVIKKIINDGYCLFNNIDNQAQLIILLKEMIEHDVWFYIAQENGKIIANSKSSIYAFSKLLNKGCIYESKSKGLKL